jgi:parallel beta-helix repeat protein
MVVGNDVHDNEYKGAYIDKTSRNNIVYNNNIINNKIYNAYCMGVNQWDNGKRGNHYSEFDDDQEGCRDADGNSICDSGYTIPGGSNVDSHPLISWRRDYDA